MVMVGPGIKYCKRCDTNKPVEEFYKVPNRPNTYSVMCKKCQLEYNKEHNNNAINSQRYNLKKKYGITYEEYLKMLMAQKNRCAICNELATDKNLAVDHDHLTERVRGLLCQSCNNGLGRFKDSIELLKSAQRYLEQTIPPE